MTDFRIVPRDPTGFSKEALQTMRAHLHKYPHYVRPDGLLVLRPTQEMVDYVTTPEFINKPPHPNSVWFDFEATGITCGVHDSDSWAAVTAEFVLFCQQRWACDFVDVVGTPVDVERFYAWTQRR